mmetsp:Transcript_95742/g.270966  ORF Transcript_95742/g.270966 Transcript_95742/m.270966 type:complete len:476 (+) Transcript_95742:80-1507(+)|eukprot:CAMPEP_0117504548 /NCGR_PEP_ID=MMETSP0784-20121206/24906_1 /TAXON_ID=39447 /ORGANISM="" /LENGTH=475 /DNA_ID=CAMNT_0005299907 /DNA_START=68 /DNA_END=1495 /DNA_ORIENTATION=+
MDGAPVRVVRAAAAPCAILPPRRTSRGLLPTSILAVTIAAAFFALAPGELFAVPSNLSRRSIESRAPAPPAQRWQLGSFGDELPADAWVGLRANPTVGVAAPAALLAFATLQAGTDGVSLVGIDKESQMERGARTLMRQAPVTFTPQMFKDYNAVPRTAATTTLAVGFFLWYAANVSFNIVNKQAINLFPYAWMISVVQLAVVVICSVFGWATGTIESPRSAMGPGFLRRLLPAALCHALGNGLTSVAFACGSVSFTHVIKTSEPIWMALGSFLLSGSTMPPSQFLALVPIMLGVALASAGELSFTWVGFLAALGSTICFAGRGIFSKRLMSGSEGADSKRMSPLNVYALDSALALCFTLPVALFLDGPRLAAAGGLGAAAVASCGAQLATLLMATGLSYYAYNAIAFKLLDKLDVVSHAVGNLGKRIFVIGFSVVAFHTPLSTHAIIGSVTAIAGSGLYSYVKATAGKRKAAVA